MKIYFFCNILFNILQKKTLTVSAKLMAVIMHSLCSIPKGPPQFENQIMAWVYVRSIMPSTMYQKASFCSPGMAQ